MTHMKKITDMIISLNDIIKKDNVEWDIFENAAKEYIKVCEETTPDWSEFSYPARTMMAFVLMEAREMCLFLLKVETSEGKRIALKVLYDCCKVAVKYMHL